MDTLFVLISLEATFTLNPVAKIEVYKWKVH